MTFQGILVHQTMLVWNESTGSLVETKAEPTSFSKQQIFKVKIPFLAVPRIKCLSPVKNKKERKHSSVHLCTSHLSEAFSSPSTLLFITFLLASLLEGMPQGESLVPDLNCPSCGAASPKTAIRQESGYENTHRHIPIFSPPSPFPSAI